MTPIESVLPSSLPTESPPPLSEPTSTQQTEIQDIKNQISEIQRQIELLTGRLAEFIAGLGITLRPVAPDGTNNGVFCVNTCWDRIDDDPDSTDGIVIYGDGDKRRGGADYVFVNFSDMPADFVSMEMLAPKLRVSLQSPRTDDNSSLYIQVYDGLENAPLTEEKLVTSNSVLFPATVNVVFSTVSAGNKATWDGAELRLRWIYQQNRSPELAYINLDAVELSGTYAR
ncbi:MAG: hypothetical protein A3J67_04540 [Parcubacteria group bacterium RIFCSPHIGHO2_02_FULL_48_10b]|nr:MAG: hypothetical protein A3J67_04540 [Parcubacteria group bacterium RIFCSPHIGHO2_02_FULL_48_10b]